MSRIFFSYYENFPRMGMEPCPRKTGLLQLNRNLKEVVKLLVEDGEPTLEAEFVGTRVSL
jgi:hypothetical protein